MPLVVHRATLGRHVFNVLMLPFTFMLAAAIVRGWKLAIIAVCVAVLYFAGALGSMTWLGRDQVLSLLGVVIILWLLGILGSVFDHFRYSGWQIADGREKVAVQSFVDALLASDFSGAYSQCTSRYKLERGLDRFSSDAKRILDDLGGHRTIMRLNVPGRWELDILARAIPSINAVADDRTEAVGLILLCDAKDRGDSTAVPTLRVRLKEDPEGPRIDSFDRVNMALQKGSLSTRPHLCAMLGRARACRSRSTMQVAGGSLPY